MVNVDSLAAVVPEPGVKFRRVSAGPGTGKSTGLCETLTSLIRDQGVPANRILVLSFTKASAADLKAELTSEERAIPNSQDIHIRTLHSECFRILTEAHQPESQGRIPRPLMDFEQKFLEKDLATGAERDMRKCHKLINAFEAEWTTSQDDDPGFSSDPVEQAFQEELIGWLRFHRAMLIGEVVPLTRRFLAADPDQPVLSAYDYIFVDEYQDLNRADQEVVFKLAAIPNARLIVLGDENQSIYSFRHAHPQGLTQFPGGRPGGLTEQTHDECYRCPITVVDMANALISNNMVRAPHVLRHGKRESGLVDYRIAPSVDEEAQGIAAWVQSALDESKGSDDPIGLKDVLVLVPRREIGRKIVTQLKRSDLSARTVFREELLKPDLSQEAMTLLTLMADPDDRVAFRCWLGLGRDDRAKEEYARIRAAADSETSPRAYIEGLDRPTAARQRLGRVWDRTQQLNRKLGELATLEMTELIDHLFPPSDEILSELRDIVTRAGVIQESVEKVLIDIREALLKNDPGPDDEDVIRVMTYWSAKGLSARVVVLASCVQGLMPCGDRSDQTFAERNTRLEEQRRLFYVGVTRTKERLLISRFSRSYSDLNPFTLRVVDPTGANLSRQRITPSAFLMEMQCPDPVPYGQTA